MTDYNAKLRELESTSNVLDDVKRGKALLTKYGTWLERYHGGLPVGVLAAIMLMESGGKMDAPGDVSLGEVGLYQITASFPTRVGLPAQSRYDAQTNVFLGSLEYQLGAAEAKQRWGALVALGSQDNWKLSRLAFAVGASGARRLVEAAQAKGLVHQGAVFDGVRALVDSGGSFALSSGQPADKVRYRVHAIDHNFKVGLMIRPGFFTGPMTLPPAPGAESYQIPIELRPYMNQITRGTVARGGLIVGAASLFTGLVIAIGVGVARNR